MFIEISLLMMIITIIIIEDDTTKLCKIAIIFSWIVFGLLLWLNINKINTKTRTERVCWLGLCVL